MNQPGRRRLILGLVAASLAISIILTIIFRQQVRAWLVMPVSYVAWYINTILSTVPQPVFWALLVFGGFILSTRVILKSMAPAELPEPQTYAGRSISRYQYWLWYFSSFQVSHFATEHMARNLARLLIDILAFQENLTADEVEDRVYTGQLDLPDDVRALIKTRQFDFTRSDPPALVRFLDRLLRRQRAPVSNQIDNREAREKITRIIHFIEDRLEISHESTP
ncbi:MAG TPA: hypothetical protein PJ988_09225 [Anaerolinea sp.]|nr:hypothetical protein [Anaerolinea sp.]